MRIRRLVHASMYPVITVEFYSRLKLLDSCSLFLRYMSLVNAGMSDGERYSKFQKKMTCKITGDPPILVSRKACCTSTSADKPEALASGTMK